MKRYIGIVLKKELTDILRDRRSVIAGLLLPLVLYPLMFMLMGSFVNKATSNAENNTNVAVAGSSEVFEFVRDQMLGGLPGIKVSGPYTTQEALSEGGPDLIIIMDSVSAAQLESGEPVDITVAYNDEKSSATFSLPVLQNALEQYNQRRLTQKLAEIGVTIEELTPLHISVSTRGQLTGQDSGGANVMLNMMLPMLVVIYLSVGGMSVAIDMFAGEKERHTMEALLCTRAGRGDILVGKFIAVVLFSLVSVMSSVAGMAVSYMVMPEMLEMGSGGSESALTVGAGTLVIVVVIVMLLAMLFSALQVMVSCWSRSVKEAGTYSMFFMLVSYVPVFATMMMQAGDFTFWMAFIPVFNVLGCLKMLLAGISDYLFMLTTLVTVAACLFIALMGTRRMFKNENVVLR